MQKRVLMPRDGAKLAEIAAEFDVTALPAVTAWLEEQALEHDGECKLMRVENSEGRTRA